MIKLNITLGNSFFEHFCLSYSDDFGQALPKIRQHRIVLNKRIIEYYIECAKTKGLKDFAQTFLAKEISDGGKIYFEDDCGTSNIIEELIAVSMKQRMKILLAEKAEVEKVTKDVKLYRINDIISKDNCLINLYSLPVTSRYIPAKNSVEAYKKWIRNWIEGEKRVVIRDKYLMTDLLSFKNHFLPLFDKGMKIEIQTDSDVEQKDLDIFDQPEYADYDISVAKCENMHERVMIFDNFQIVLGAGVAIFSGDWNLTKESFISISKVTIPNIDKTVVQVLR